ncbi:MAG: hypothetical protein WBA31_01250 [Candidatus Dormiibacterota bacterium]
MAHEVRGVEQGERTIRPSLAHRQRAALAAGIAVGAVIVPLSVVVGLLAHAWTLIPLCVFVTLLVVVASFNGQRHNEVFVGPRGVRRQTRDGDLIASWPSLASLEVTVPGNRIVAFTLQTSGIVVERTKKGHSNRAESLLRHPPEGFELRLDRGAADALVAEISSHRPRLKGLAQWERASRPKPAETSGAASA